MTGDDALTQLDTLVGGNSKRENYLPDAELVHWLNKWLRRVTRDTNWAQASPENINITAGTSAYTPTTARIEKVLYVKLDDGGGTYPTALLPTTYERIMESGEGDPTITANRAEPTHYYITYASGVMVLNLWPTPITTRTNGVKARFRQGPTEYTSATLANEIPVPRMFHEALPFELARVYYAKREDGKMGGVAIAMQKEHDAAYAQALADWNDVQEPREPMVTADFGGTYL